MANILLKKHFSISLRRKDLKRKGKKGRKRKEKIKVRKFLDKTKVSKAQDRCIFNIFHNPQFLQMCLILTLFLTAMGRINPYMSVSWQQSVGIGLTGVVILPKKEMFYWGIIVHFAGLLVDLLKVSWFRKQIVEP